MKILSLIYSTSSLLVQDELTIREQAIHQVKLIYAAGRLVAFTSLLSLGQA